MDNIALTISIYSPHSPVICHQLQPEPWRI